MSKEKRLIKNTMIFTIGNFSTKFITFLLLPFYTYYLSTFDYGYVDIVSSFVSLFIPIVSFQLMDGCYRYLIITEEKENQNKIISNAFIVVFRNLILANLVYIALNGFIEIRYSFIILIQFNAAIIQAFMQQSIRGLKKNYIYSMAGIIFTVCTLVSNIILIAFMGLKAEGLIISNIIGYVFSFTYIIISCKFISYIKFSYKDEKIAKELISYSLPLIPNSLNWWIMNVSDRIIINIFQGVSGNGIYAIANKFPQVVDMMCKTFNMAWQESAITEYDSDLRDEFYSKVFNDYITIVYSITILMLSGTRILFSIGINEKFVEAYNYVPFLLYGVVFSTFASFYGTAYQSTKNTKGAFVSSVLGSVVNFVINITLIQIIGIYAASLSTMISFLFMWIYRIFDTKKYFNIKIKWNRFIWLVILSVMYIVVYYTNHIVIINLLGIIGAIIIFIYFNYYNISKIIMKVIRKVMKREV